MSKIFTNTLAILLAIFLYSCAGCSNPKKNDKSTEKEETSGKRNEGNIKPQEITLSLYIENSASMLGYDGSQNGGQFKQVVSTLFNGFEKVGKSPAINYVNESAQPFQGNFRSIITNNIFNLDKDSQSSSTNFAVIFDKIIGQTNNDSISVLFSDLIYSDTKNASNSADNLLSRVENLTANAFNKNSSNLSLIIIKFEGDFIGGYYTYNSPSKSNFYKGKRPFYMVVVAKNSTMKRFLTEDKFKQVASFKDYPNFKDLVYFSVKGLKDSPKYSILIGDSKNKGTFKTGEKIVDIHDINDVSPPVGSSQKLTLAVGISLPANVFSGSEIDTSNFEIGSIKDKFKIIKLEPIDRKDGLTHRMILEAQKIAKGERKVEIKLRKQTPKWIQEANTKDDSKMKGGDKDFEIKTFGIAPLIQGVQRAYTTTNENNNYTFTLMLNLNENN